MINSIKNTTTKELMIGRLAETPYGVKPNDIVLPQSDKGANNLHCQIIYKDGFKLKKTIPDYFFTFLLT